MLDIHAFLKAHLFLALGVCFATSLFAGIIFCWVAYSILGVCFTRPCLEVETFLHIDRGLDFELTCHGLMSVVLPTAGLYIIYRRNCGELLGGLFLGLFMLHTMNALIDAVIWSSRASMAAELKSSISFLGWDVAANTSIYGPFIQLSMLAGVSFLLSLLVVAMLCMYAHDVFGSPAAVGAKGTAGRGSGGEKESLLKADPFSNPFQQQDDHDHGSGGEVRVEI